MRKRVRNRRPGSLELFQPVWHPLGLLPERGECPPHPIQVQQRHLHQRAGQPDDCREAQDPPAELQQDGHQVEGDLIICSYLFLLF